MSKHDSGHSLPELEFRTFSYWSLLYPNDFWQQGCDCQDSKTVATNLSAAIINARIQPVKPDCTWCLGTFSLVNRSFAMVRRVGYLRIKQYSSAFSPTPIGILSGLTLWRSKTDVLPRHFDIFLLHQTQKTQKMKSIKIILAIVLTIQTGVLFAGNENFASVSEMNSTVILMTIAPSTPVEAIFEEVVVDNTFLGLIPATPDVASFEDF